VLSAEVGGKHGFSVSGLVFDEIHTQPNRQLYDVLTKGSSDARQNSLHFIITTAGTDRHSIAYELHTKTVDILEGRRVDPTFYPVVYGLKRNKFKIMVFGMSGCLGEIRGSRFFYTQKFFKKEGFVMKEFWNMIQLVFTGVGGWLGYFLGGCDGLLLALVVFVVMDYVTGVMCAVADRTLSSEVGFKGICRKILIFMLVGVANVLDVHIIGTAVM
jgi:hypothetical protein